MVKSVHKTGILVVRLSALGDVANTLPAVSALRRQVAPLRIGWLLEEPSRELVEAARVADEIFVFPRKRFAWLFRRPWRWPTLLIEFYRFTRVLRRAGYACTLDFQGNLKSGFLCLLSGAPDRIGFAAGHCKEMNWLFNNFLAMPVSKHMLRAEKHAALAQVIEPELELTPVSLLEDEESADFVKQFLAALPGTGPLVILHPGTSDFGGMKRWPTERFGEVATMLHSGVGARCVVTRGPFEEHLAAQVVSSSKGIAHMAPILSLKQLIELLRRAHIVIACDTGPLHIAAFLHRPVVDIIGPKDPRIYAPYDTPHAVVQAKTPCTPCTRRKCDDMRCLSEIAPSRVAEAARNLLAFATSDKSAGAQITSSQIPQTKRPLSVL